MTNVHRLLDSILDGGARDLRTAGELEVELDELFPDDDLVQEFVVLLAQYRPGGGEFLYDETDLVKWARWARGYLAGTSGSERM